MHTYRISDSIKYYTDTFLTNNYKNINVILVLIMLCHIIIIHNVTKTDILFNAYKIFITIHSVYLSLPLLFIKQTFLLCYKWLLKCKHVIKVKRAR